MGDVVSNIVGAITHGIKWIRSKYRQFKVWLAEQLIAALAKGWTAALTIVALVTASIVVGYVWQIMMQNAIVIAVLNMVKSVGSYISQLAAFLQVDMILALIQLGVLVNDELYQKLSPLYDELGNLAQELELDFNYITTFLEVDRAILQATYSFTNFGFLKADLDYVKGLQAWLAKLGKRMSDYAADPQAIFTDIQKAIAEERVQAANDAVAEIWAAIDFAGDWVRDKGEILLTMVNEIDAAVNNMPEKIQEAIKPWYEDTLKRIRAFEEEKWDPFWIQYNDFSETVSDLFQAVGMDIEEIQRRIDDPLDWLRTLLAMDPEDGATLRSTLNDFLGLPDAAVVAKEIQGKGVAAVRALDAIMEAKEKAALEPPKAPDPIVGILTVEPAPITEKGPALVETSDTPWPPGKMADDGRGWYVG